MRPVAYSLPNLLQTVLLIYNIIMIIVCNRCYGQIERVKAAAICVMHRPGMDNYIFYLETVRHLINSILFKTLSC
jgi:hypothetical protein